MARPGILTPVEAPVPRSAGEQARAADLIETGTPALVLGADVTALGTVRCLGRAGIRPYLIGREGDFAARSRWAKSLHGYVPATVEPGELVGTLEQLPLERAVLTPCSDAWCEAVTALPPATARRFPVSMPSQAIIDAFVDKGAFATQLAQSAVPHPRTILVDSADDLDSVSDADLPRFFLKPRTSHLFNQRFHCKAFSLSDRADARARYAEMEEVGLEAVLQEYVPGPATSHYFIDGFVDRDGVVAARFARRRIRMYPTDFGNSSIMVSVPLSEVSQAVGDLDRLLADVGYRGIFSAEFKLDARDGVLRIIEINTRAWWYVEFAALCGVDVCRLAHRDALGLPVDPIGEYRLGKRFVFLGQDLRAFLALRDEHALGFPAWIRSVAGARTAILRWNDPMPAVARSARRLRQATRRRQ